jgi:hypothetical protein
MGLGLAQPTRLGLTQPVSLWVGQTDPDLLRSLTSLSLPRALPRTLIAVTIACRFRPPPAISATATSGKRIAPLPSTSSTKWIRRSPPLWWDLWPNPARVLPAPVASELDALLGPFVGLDARVCGGRGACAAPVEAPKVGCSRCFHGEVTLGCTWPAAWALPRHAFQASGWAIGECLLLLLLPFSSLAAVTNHLGYA